ncbi:MAG: protease inhibitor I42 family protein [Candidatus Acidiferrum sp.]
MSRPSPITRICFIPAILSVFAVAITLTAKTLLLDDSDNSTHIFLNVGDVISIKLTANVTTGYSWEAVSVPPCLLREASQQKQKSNPRMGESGFQVFVFRAKEVCNAVVALNYFRPFEKDKPPGRTFTIDVTVQQRSGNAGRISN